MADTSQHLMTVFSSQGFLPAEVVKNKLEASGIPAILRYQAISRVIAVTVDGIGLVEVLVTQADYQRALEIIAPVTDEETPQDDS